MTKTNYLIYRDGAPIAELCLKFDNGGGLEHWEWKGDSAVGKALGIPGRRERELYIGWHIHIAQKAEEKGFTFEMRTEGEHFAMRD